MWRNRDMFYYLRDDSRVTITSWFHCEIRVPEFWLAQGDCHLQPVEKMEHIDDTAISQRLIFYVLWLKWGVEMCGSFTFWLHSGQGAIKKIHYIIDKSHISFIYKNISWAKNLLSSLIHLLSYLRNLYAGTLKFK